MNNTCFIFIKYGCINWGVKNNKYVFIFLFYYNNYCVLFSYYCEGVFFKIFGNNNAFVRSKIFKDISLGTNKCSSK